MMAAAAEGHLARVQSLVEAEADVGLRDEEGETAATRTAKGGHRSGWRARRAGARGRSRGERWQRQARGWLEGAEWGPWAGLDEGRGVDMLVGWEKGGG
jgi:hypothetical protein